LVPTFANPTGLTISHQDRVRLVQLAHDYDMLIICDDVYQLLYFYELPPHRLVEYDLQYISTYGGMGRVISNQTFSKILAPGLRLGWIEAEERLICEFAKSTLLYSGGSVNHFTSCLVGNIIKSGKLKEHVDRIRKEYCKRSLVLCDSLKRLLPTQCHFVPPIGGYFVWIYLGFCAQSMLGWNLSEIEHRRGERVSATQGDRFSIKGGFKDWIRVSFAMYQEDELEEGGKRLGRLIKMYKEKLDKESGTEQ
jgi:2-aminoadipate transaminase